jgi:Zn-dependent peptidase ImmA (M78 family)
MMPRVNPDILKWARETAGLTPVEAAAALGFKDTRGATAEERLLGLELGDAEPSRSLLLRMAKQYRRSLLVLYQTERPSKAERGHDFRTLPQERSAAAEGALDALVRDIAVRQGLVRSVIEAEPDATRLTFVGSMDQRSGVEAVAQSIQRTIKFEIEEFRAAASAALAFAALRARTEAVGIFVLLAGNLGSHHTSIDVEHFRGFAIADPFAPFVVINDQDARSAWSFTLLHELAHLWLGESGISGYATDDTLEQFCNDVASSLLLPGHELNQLALGQTDTDALAASIGGFAASRNISSTLVAYRLYRAGRIGARAWNTLRDFFYRRWTDERVGNRARNRESENGPNYYIVRRHRIGPALVDFVRRSLAEGELTTVKAGRVLGVRPKNVQGVIQPVARSARRVV